MYLNKVFIFLKNFQIKDSLETSKRLIQDINDHCLRNKRIQSERELRLQEENRRLELKREEELAEVLLKELEENEISKELNEINAQNENGDTSESKLNDEELDLINNDDELLKKILNRNLNSNPGLLSPINDDLINYFSIDTDEKLFDEPNNAIREDDGFQIVENNEINSIKDIELDLVVFR